MCGCNGGTRIPFDGIFRIKNSEDVETVKLKALSTASRRYKTPSGRSYLGGSMYEYVLAYPEDVEYLLSLTEHFSEE